MESGAQNPPHRYRGTDSVPQADASYSSDPFLPGYRPADRVGHRTELFDRRPSSLKDDSRLLSLLRKASPDPPCIRRDHRSHWDPKVPSSWEASRGLDNSSLEASVSP